MERVRPALSARDGGSEGPSIREPELSVVRLVIAVVVTTVFGLLAVAEQLATIRAGYEIDKARRALDALREERRQLELVVGRLSTPEALQARAAAFRFDLAIPDRPRVVRVRPRRVDDHAFARIDRTERRTAARGR